MSPSPDFKIGEKVVYPSHGVGKIIEKTAEVIAGNDIKLYVIDFPEDKMTLRVPFGRVKSSGLRLLSNVKMIQKATSVLKGRAKTSRGMWSRRAKEYEDKINSGSIISISEVIRDLHKNVDDPDRSYSERIIYESALGRLAREFAAVNSESVDESKSQIEQVLISRKSVTSSIEEESVTSEAKSDSFDVFFPDKVA